ncbi:MAG: hypothetical protein ACRDFW_10445, partial [bacterium]
YSLAHSRSGPAPAQHPRAAGVDRVRKRVIMAGRNIAYDLLVLATGATHGYFGNEIRRRLLLAFERAECV